MGGEVWVPVLLLFGLLVVLMAGCCGRSSWADDDLNEGEGR